MTTLDFNTERCNHLLETIKTKIPNSTYVSFLIFKNSDLIKIFNNNFNDWPSHYTSEDLKYDEVFYEISHKRIRQANQAICFWNSIPHETKESLKIDNKRKQYGLYNGVTLLQHYDNEYTLGINLTSDNLIDEDSFYSQVILKRKDLLSKLVECVKPS